jgi:uncharacterized membrane protein YbhN (UPF0104 family)
MSSSRWKWTTLLKWTLATSVVFLLFSAFQHYSSEVRQHAAKIDRGYLLAGLAVCIVYRVLNSAGWVLILRAMQAPLPLGRGMHLWLLAESMRWLPGSVWGFCSRVYAAVKNGVPPAIASASLPLELLLTILAWSIVAAAGLFGSGLRVDLAGLLTPRVILLTCAGFLAIGLFLAICLLKLPDGRLATKFKSLRLEMNVLRSAQLQPAILAGVLVLYTSLCCLNGIAFFLIVRSVSGEALGLGPTIGINACGWLLGFLAIGAPGGIGVREAGSAFLLGAIISLPAAITASVLWRLVMIVDEAICLLVCIAPKLAGLIVKPKAVLNPVT